MKKLLFLGMFSVLLACSQSGEAPVLPGKVGPAGELLVVASESVWNGPVGAAIREVVAQPYPVLPQAESHFDLVNLDPRDFDKFWKPHRNIIYIEVGQAVEQTISKVEFARNRYSSGQIYIEARGKSQQELADAIISRGNEILSILHKEEVDRLAANVRAFDNEALNADLMEKYGLTLDIPRDMFVVAEIVDTSDERLEFLWLQREMTRMKGGNNHDIKEGVFVYTYPYTTDSIFSMNWLLEKRQDMLRKYVPGPTDGSYMANEMHLVPTYEEVVFKGMFASEVRGLWKMQNDFMGGPYYMLTFYDEANQRIVSVDGYAYAPYFDKREYMREVEAIVKTLTLKGAGA
ncbi:MAG: DUF4837 family protein [Flavobacteriales bacterium]|nr:DUF4837 family protein [Flavobacteriales bacterium]